MTAGRGPNRAAYDVESLLAVAVRVFNERGFDGTSMEDLSRELGISKSAIYHHVESKDALLGLALDRALDGLDAVADRVRATDLPAIDRLELLVHDSVLVLVADLPYVSVLLRARGNTAVERRAVARRRAFDHLASELVSQAARDGDMRTDVEADLAARLLFGLVNSLIEWYTPRKGDNGSSIADTVVRVGLGGLRIDRPGTAAGRQEVPG